MMALFHCDKCWERPCICGYEAAEAKRFRREFYADFGRKPPEEEMTRYEVHDIDQTAEVAALKAERDRLRAALKEISSKYAGPEATIARRALEGK